MARVWYVQKRPFIKFVYAVFSRYKRPTKKLLTLIQINYYSLQMSGTFYCFTCVTVCIIGTVFWKNRSDFFVSFFVPTFTVKQVAFPTKQNTLYMETFKHLMYFLYLMRLIFLIISSCDQAEFYKSQGKKASAFTENTENSFYFSLHQASQRSYQCKFS